MISLLDEIFHESLLKVLALNVLLVKVEISTVAIFFI